MCHMYMYNTTPHAHTFHPVAWNVFPALPTVTVLSHIPGKEAAQTRRYATSHYTHCTRTSTVYRPHAVLFSTYSNVLIARVDQPLVDLVTDTNHVVTFTEISNQLQLSFSEHLGGQQCTIVQFTILHVLAGNLELSLAVG